MRELNEIELEQVGGGGLVNPVSPWLPGSTGPTNPMSHVPVQDRVHRRKAAEKFS
jgi:hypothetical protein